MNLLQSMMEKCVMMDKTTVGDGMGSFDAVWVEGAEFDAFVRKESAPEIRVAEKDGAKEMFTVVVPMNVTLEYHDVFKRLRDGAIFRLTSNTKDGETSASASTPVQVARANCERWELT